MTVCKKLCRELCYYNILAYFPAAVNKNISTGIDNCRQVQTPAFGREKPSLKTAVLGEGNHIPLLGDMENSKQRI